METIEFRLNRNVLEYRCLLIFEKDLYQNGEPCGEVLYIDWKQRYSEWKAVPKVSNIIYYEKPKT